nr:MAG TPA: hypothetical protein [Caudoviricetes sp.]
MCHCRTSADNTIISYIYSFKYCHICPKIDIVPYRYSTA